MRTQEWALRIIHELGSWDKAIFITLTYKDDELPIKGLSKEHVVKFFKRLRSDIGERRIKYFACGEYGEKGRGHYHAIIFGLGPDDTDLIDEAWGKGWTYFGTVTFDSAAYVAGYIQKKLNGEKAKEEYGDKVHPFQLQSKAFGYEWMEKNKEKIITNMTIRHRGVQHSVPRYYLKKLTKLRDKEKEDNAVKERARLKNEYLARKGLRPENEKKRLKELRAQKAREQAFRMERRKSFRNQYL